MDIKEIALKVADSLRNKVDGISHMQSNQGLARFAEALIESYKAELLKEVGEPVAKVEQHARMTSQSTTLDRALRAGTTLFTSDQVAAAILKVTGPLKHELRELRMSTRMRGEDIDELRAQLAAAQEENKLIMLNLTQCGDQLAKAEQRVAEWVSVETQLPGEQGFDSEEVLCFLNGHCSITDFECRQGGGWGIRLGYYDADISMFRTHGRPDNFVTHWMPLPKAPNGASS